MAFNKRSLVRYASAPFGSAGKNVGFHVYATADAVATVIAAGYFNENRDKLKVNDVIDCVCLVDGAADRVSLLVTAAPASGNVTVAVNTDATGA